MAVRISSASCSCLQSRRATDVTPRRVAPTFRPHFVGVQTVQVLLARTTSSLPSRISVDSLLHLYTGAPEAESALRQLLALLDSTPGCDSPAAPTRWLEELVGWLRTEGPVPTRRGRLAPVESTGSARLRLLVEVLAESPFHCDAVRAVVARVLSETSALRLLTDVGLSGGRGLLGDAAARLALRWVPSGPEERDLTALLWRLFPTAADATWLDELAEEHVNALFLLLRGQEPFPVFAPLSEAVADAVVVLAARSSAYGTASDVLSRLPPGPLGQSPFLRLQRACEALREAVCEGTPGEGMEDGELEPTRSRCADALAQCHAAVHAVFRQMEESAVDTDLVYRLDQLALVLERLERLLWLLAPERPQTVAQGAKRLLATLVRSHVDERSVTRLFRGSVRYVARRIFEHTGEVGRHYITTSKDEYRHMVKAAAGGGLLTVGTAGLKLMITFAALPLFFEGIAASGNYAISFMLLQLFGFALATKQPSMTAAAFAATVDLKSGDKGMRGLVEQLARISRSQLASVIGNLGAVSLGCAVVGAGLWAVRGRPMLEADEAGYVLHSLHPFESGTILFAAITGVLLWMSSVFGGWLENLVHYRRIPEAVARHRGLVRLLGEAGAQRVGELLKKNACGLGANIGLGVLLGMTPVACKFFGIPLDVRHVTLSTGTLALAAASLPVEHLLHPDFLWAVAGIGFVAVMNLSVSFSLGLNAAVRSRGMKPVGFLRLARAVLAGGIRSLSDFILPPQPLQPARRPRSAYDVRSAARARPSADRGPRPEPSSHHDTHA